MGPAPIVTEACDFDYWNIPVLKEGD